MMILNTCIPQWLDVYIYAELKANYCCSNSNISVIDWNRKNVLNYLGTYFLVAMLNLIVSLKNSLVKNK